MYLWPCYRLVKAGWATIGELSTIITRPEVLDANEMLDAIDEVEEDASKKK